MNEIEIQTTAIETNVRTLIKTHPDPKQFIETLRNEAIDQAFQEVNETFQDIRKLIENHSQHIHKIEKVLQDANLWDFEE